MIDFDWDPNKAKSNLTKHNINFDEAKTIFNDFLSITLSDKIHSEYEDRFITIGMSKQMRLLVVFHTDRNETIRIISARLATKKEKTKYEEG